MEKDTRLIMKQNNIIIGNQVSIMKSLIDIMRKVPNEDFILELMEKVNELELMTKETFKALK